MDFGASIVWKSEGLVVVDKPAGVLSQPGAEGPNLVDLARAHFGLPSIGVLHRLDRNVSGLVMLATRKAEARAMSDAFARGAVDRRYTAIVRGTPPDTLVLDAWLEKNEDANLVRAKDASAIRVGDDGRFVPARTEVTTEQRFSALFGRGAVVEARPITGRSHQIRVHLAHAGFPIVGDAKYGVRVRGLDRPLLHARELRFVDPASGVETTVRAPPPFRLEEIRALRRLPVTPPGRAARKR